MRVFYVFKMNKYFSYVYKNNPYKIYKMLEEVYHTKDYDVVLTYKLFEQIAIPFNKIKLNDYLNTNYINKKDYFYKGNIHIITNNDEYSKLVVSNANLKIKVNINYSSFFKTINEYSENIFICDFGNKDYFWLDKIVKKDRQNDKYKVK